MASLRLTRAFMVAVVALAALLAVNATQVMQRPDTYKETPHNLKSATDAPVHRIERRAAGKQNVGYFTNW
jgi:chitinase